MSKSSKSECEALLKLMKATQCFSVLALLPCLPPPSTLQVDVDGDGERPPGRSCVPEHSHSSLSQTLPSPKYVHLTSCSLSQSVMSCLPDCRLFTGGLPVVYQGSKVTATTPSTPLCVSIETSTGKAGSMLMASQWACDAQL